jgi:quinol monooxygenase YgiN
VPPDFSLPPPSYPAVLILHEVADYPAWKTVFDGAASLRREAGEISFEVLRDTDQPELVVHLSSWKSHAAARSFFASPRLEEIRRQAGVKSPRFLYLNRVAAGEL